MQSHPNARLALAAALAGLAMLAAPGAQAADFGAVVGKAFGNTVLATYPDGRSQRLWLHEDGVYDAVGRSGRASSGRWTVKADKVCLKQVKPFAAPFTYCTPFPADTRLGAVWTSKDMSGTPIRLTVVKGMDWTTGR